MLLLRKIMVSLKVYIGVSLTNPFNFFKVYIFVPQKSLNSLTLKCQKLNSNNSKFKNSLTYAQI